MSEPQSPYQFEVGELVEHRRYGYRGAIAGRDPRCKASDEWYRSNQTQPEKSQPWYHVLVHGAQHSTYVAQSNLQVDEGGEQIVHPLARHVFEYFRAGKYVRRRDVNFSEYFGE